MTEKWIRHSLQATKLQFESIGTESILKDPGKHYIRIAQKLEAYKLAYRCRM